MRYIPLPGYNNKKCARRNRRERQWRFNRNIDDDEDDSDRSADRYVYTLMLDIPIYVCSSCCTPRSPQVKYIIYIIYIIQYYIYISEMRGGGVGRRLHTVLQPSRWSYIIYRQVTTIRFNIIIIYIIFSRLAHPVTAAAHIYTSQCIYLYIIMIMKIIICRYSRVYIDNIHTHTHTHRIKLLWPPPVAQSK